MDTYKNAPVVFRDDAERTYWWNMLVTVSTAPDGPVFDQAVEWADDSIRAMRNRSTPDVNVTPAEANDLYAAGYRYQPGAEAWVKAVPVGNSTGSILVAYNGLEKGWIKQSGSRSVLRTATWDPSKQSLAGFLRESEAGS